MDALNELIRRALAFFDRIKTRISGYIVIVLGALLTMGPQFQQILSAKQLAYTTIIAGVIVAGIGHYNARKNDPALMNEVSK